MLPCPVLALKHFVTTTIFNEEEVAIGKLKSYKFPGTDQILAELTKAGGETLCSEIH
jgi:hypothetical protein